MAKREKNYVKEEDFGLKLAIVDTFPVLFFFGSMVVLYRFFPSRLFLLGTLCSLCAGVSKVLWKYMMALKLGNKEWLSRLFIPLQCMGFLLVVISLVVRRAEIDLHNMLSAVMNFPAILFFGIGILSIIGMIILSVHFDQSIEAHWKAQYANIFAQGSIFVGLLMIR